MASPRKKRKEQLSLMVSFKGKPLPVHSQNPDPVIPYLSHQQVTCRECTTLLTGPYSQSALERPLARMSNGRQVVSTPVTIQYLLRIRYRVNPLLTKEFSMKIQVLQTKH